MKLFYAPGACSQAPHIILREAGRAFQAVKVDLKAKRTEAGEDYRAINSKGSVPALALDDGSVLTENAAILQYIADQAGDLDLLPLPSRFERYRVLEWLNYIATELHKGFGPLWHPNTADEGKASTRELIAGKFDWVQSQLGDRPFLTGEHFTVADAYLFVILGWTRVHAIDLGRWPALAAYAERIGQRPAVQATLQAEGLLQ